MTIVIKEDNDDSTETVGGWDNIQLRPVVLWIYQHNFKFSNERSYKGMI